MPTQLSPHFTLEELIKSDAALRHGIDNTPPPQAVECLRVVVNAILEPVRLHYGVPFSPSSGYRCLALNALIKGSANSQHMLGQAADFEVPGVANYDLASWIAGNLAYDQLILEFYKSGEPNSGWVHCSVTGDGPNRRMARTYDGVRYSESLIA